MKCRPASRVWGYTCLPLARLRGWSAQLERERTPRRFELRCFQAWNSPLGKPRGIRSVGKPGTDSEFPTKARRKFMSVPGLQREWLLAGILVLVLYFAAQAARGFI